MERRAMPRLELGGPVQIEVTTRCNLSCPACLRGAPASSLAERELPREIFDRVLDATARPGQRYHLQGWGEPLLRSDLPDLAEAIGRRGGLASVTTNGTPVTADLADRLVAAGLDFITISVAGGTPESQRSNRPGTELERILEAFRTLRKARKRQRRRRPLLAASYEMTRSSIDSFHRVVGKLKRAGAEKLIALHPILVLSAEQERNLLIPPDDPDDERVSRRSLRRAAVATMWRSVPFEFEPLVSAAPAVCRENPLESLFVSASGDVAPCVFLGPPVEGPLDARYLGRNVVRTRVTLGDLHRSGLREIWESEAYRAFREAFHARAEEADSATGEIRSPLPEPCRVCLRALGY